MLPKVGLEVIEAILRLLRLILNYVKAEIKLFHSESQHSLGKLTGVHSTLSVRQTKIFIYSTVPRVSILHREKTKDFTIRSGLKI